MEEDQSISGSNKPSSNNPSQLNDIIGDIKVQKTNFIDSKDKKNIMDAIKKSIASKLEENKIDPRDLLGPGNSIENIDISMLECLDENTKNQVKLYQSLIKDLSKDEKNSDSMQKKFDLKSYDNLKG